MPIREVALDRDVRSRRLLPPAARPLSAHTVRRAASVGTLVVIDCVSFLLAVVLVPLASNMSALALWQQLSWWGFVAACTVILFMAAVKGLYGRRHVRHNARKVLSAWTIAFVITVVLMLAVDPHGIGARYVVVWLLAMALAGGSRWVYDAVISRVYGENGGDPPALLLGDLDSCLSALPRLAALSPESRVKVVGLVVPDRDRERNRDIGEAPPIVASHDHLGDALAATGAAQVIMAGAGSVNGQLRTIMEACCNAGVALKLVSTELHSAGDAVTHIPGLDCPLFLVRPQPAGAGSYLVKRAADRVVSALLLVVLSPLFLIIAALIKVTSHGSVLFVDQRIGVGQRPFDFYKFRTMVHDARESQGSLEELNEADGVLFKVRDDPRITRVGRILRRLSLDELPQLLSVLKGDMSLVGPRPLPLRDCELMEEWHRRRHVMLPGITGLWQVSGRSDLSFDDMVRLDLQYMETWSLKTDLHIVWRTAGAVVRSRGAY